MENLLNSIFGPLFESNRIFGWIFIAFCIGFLIYRYWGRVYIIPMDQFIVVIKSRFVEYVFTSVRVAVVPRPWDVVTEFPWNGFQYKRSIQATTRDNLKITFPEFLVKVKILDVQQSIKAPSYDRDHPGLSAQQILLPALSQIEAAIKEEMSKYPYMMDMYEKGVIGTIGEGVMSIITNRIEPSFGVGVEIFWGEPVLTGGSASVVDQYRQDRATAEAQRKRLKFDKAQKRLYGSSFPLIVAIQNIVQGRREATERLAQAIEKARPDAVTYVEGAATDLSGFGGEKKLPAKRMPKKDMETVATQARNQALVLHSASSRNNASGGNNAESTGLRAEDFE